VRTSAAHGFTLVEVLVAAGLVIVALATLAGLGLQSARASLAAAASTDAATFASARLEQLTACDGLVPSPPGTLEANVSGYVDHVDRRGLVVGTARRPPGDAVYTRRWSIQPWAAGGDGRLVLRVVVAPRAAALGRAVAGPGVAWVATLSRAGCW